MIIVLRTLKIYLFFTVSYIILQFHFVFNFLFVFKSSIAKMNIQPDGCIFLWFKKKNIILLHLFLSQDAFFSCVSLLIFLDISSVCLCGEVNSGISTFFFLLICFFFVLDILNEICNFFMLMTLNV